MPAKSANQAAGKMMISYFFAPMEKDENIFGYSSAQGAVINFTFPPVFFVQSALNIWTGLAIKGGGWVNTVISTPSNRFWP